MKKYAVSLVYQISKNDKLNFQLRLYQIESFSIEEAIGKALLKKNGEKELESYCLFLHSSIEIN